MSTKNILLVIVLLTMNSPRLNAYLINLESNGKVHSAGKLEFISSHEAIEAYYQNIHCCKDTQNADCLKIKTNIETFNNEYRNRKTKWFASRKLIDSRYFQEIIQKSERLQKYSKNDQEEILTQVLNPFENHKISIAYLILASKDPNISLQEVQLLELEAVLDNLADEIKGTPLNQEDHAKKLHRKERMRQESAQKLARIFEAARLK